MDVALGHVSRPLAWRVFHASILAASFFVLTARTVMPAGWIAGAAFVVFGSLTADAAAKGRYRLLAIVAFAGSVTLLGLALASIIVEVRWIAEVLTPVFALEIAEGVRLASLGFGGALILRALSLRHRSALALEGSAIVLAVASSVSAHRDGMIARPLEVADWFWSQGVDPVIAFLGIGIVGSMLLAGVLAHGRSKGRTVAQLFIVLLFAVFLASRIHAFDAAPWRDASRGSDEGASSGDSRDQGEGGAGSTDALPPAGEGPRARPAAVVIFHRDAQPFTGVFYFRHASFSQYNGVRLVEATLPGLDPDARHTFPSDREVVEGPQARATHRTLVATDVALLTPHSRLFALTDATEVAPMANPEPARFVRAYHVVSNLITGPLDELLDQKSGDPAWTSREWDHYTAGPKDPRYRVLAEQIRVELKKGYERDPLALALGVKRYLEETSIYSFARKYQGDDPTGDFLFSADRRGYCVHLASALALLVRTLGVPARVSAGYAVPAENLGGGSALLIKTGDAHAWAEIHLEDVGWVPIEVTPKETDVRPPPFQEADLQQLLGEMARKQGRRATEAETGFRLRDLRALFATIFEAVPWIILLLVGLSYGLKGWRLMAPFLATQRDRSRVAYRAALDRLAAGGWTRSHGETRERFARRMAEMTPSFGPLTSFHQKTVFGGERSPTEADLVSLARISGEVGREIRRALPRWRWWVGVLNPFSWLWSR